MSARSSHYVSPSLLRLAPFPIRPTGKRSRLTAHRGRDVCAVSGSSACQEAGSGAASSSPKALRWKGSGTARSTRSALALGGVEVALGGVEGASVGVEVALGAAVVVLVLVQSPPPRI